MDRVSKLAAGTPHIVEKIITYLDEESIESMSQIEEWDFIDCPSPIWKERLYRTEELPKIMKKEFSQIAHSQMCLADYVAAKNICSFVKLKKPKVRHFYRNDLPKLVLQRPDYSELAAVTDDFKLCLLDRRTFEKVSQCDEAEFIDIDFTMRIFEFILSAKLVDESRRIHFKVFHIENREIKLIQGSDFFLRNFFGKQLVVDDSTVASFDGHLIFLFPNHSMIESVFERDTTKLNDLYQTFVFTKNGGGQVFFNDELEVTQAFTPFAHCVFGKYCFLERSHYLNHNLRVDTTAFELAENGKEWREIDLSPFGDYFRTTPISIAPQIYEGERVLFNKTEKGHVTIDLFDFQRKTRTTILTYKAEEDFRVAYLSGRYLVAHVANWFYIPQSKLKIWSIDELVKRKQNPNHYSPHYEAQVAHNIFSECFVIAGDTGFLVRNNAPIDIAFLEFYDFAGPSLDVTALTGEAAL